MSRSWGAVRGLGVGLAMAVLAFLPVLTEAQEGRVVDRIDIRGNQRVEEEAIRVRLGIRQGEPLDEKQVDDDIRSIYRMGFFSDVSAEVAPDDGGSILTYVVKERPFVRSVAIEGAKKIDKEELEGTLRVRPNTILDPEKARAGIAEAKKLYEKKGYLDAKIDYVTESVGNNEVNVKFTVDEGKPVRIHKINFEGNRAFSDRELKKVMATKEKWFLSFITGAGNLDREVLNTDEERLTAYYYEHGYIDVKIDDPLIKRDEKGLEVTFKIDEGDVYQFGEVQLAGELLPELASLSERLKAKSGETFRPSELRDDINKVTEAYGDLGYAFVNVTPDTHVDPEAKKVAVTYQVTRGPEVYIDRILISGNTKTRDKVIRRELELQEQRRFSGSKLRRSQERLKRLGFFEDVSITTRKADRDDRLDLVVDVREGSTGAFSAGAGVSSGESFLFNVRLQEINLFGRGQRVVLNADFGSIRRNLSLSFTEPYFLDTQLSAGVDAYNWLLDFNEFTRGGTGGAIRLLYPFTALGWDKILGVSLVDTRLGLEYRIENAEITNVSSNAASVIRAEQGTSLTSSIIPRIYRDTRNHPFDPTSGSLQDVSFEFAGLGGDSKFYKAESRARWYFPFWNSPRFGIFTFSTGWTFGFGEGYGGGQRDLPLFERYFPGGINSVRGYGVRSLGPRIPVFAQQREPNTVCTPLDGQCQGELIRRDEVGGSSELVFNNEVIFPLAQSLGLKGVVFFDAGQAYSVSQGIDFGGMRTAAGVGVRWLSPIGPLRIEVGFPLNPRVGDNTQTILFSFGGPP
jgi:outer membrane protein insertion porin family